MNKELHKHRLLRKFRVILGFRSVCIAVCTCMLLLIAGYFMFNTDLPRFNGSAIVIVAGTNGKQGDRFTLTNDNELYHKIDKWLSSKRLCYPITYTAYRYFAISDLALSEDVGDDYQNRIWTSITICGNRIMYERVGAKLPRGIPFVSFFFTKKDAEMQSEIRQWLADQEHLRQELATESVCPEG